MAFYFTHINLIVVLLLLLVGQVFSASSKSAEQSRTSKRKGTVTIQLGTNIGGNPFLQNSYQNNPFLVHIEPQGAQSHRNESARNITHTVINTFGENKVNLSVYIHNPFLALGNGVSSGSNTSLPIDISRIDITPTATAPVAGPSNVERPQVPISLTPEPSVVQKIPLSVSPFAGFTRRKSDLKCEEYNTELLGTIEVVSLVGTTSEVTKIAGDGCGRVNALVVGGAPAKPGEFPHMVAVGKRLADGTFFFFCGGSLISPSWVLTAAHCTYGPNGIPTDARVGSHRLTDEQSGVHSTIKQSIRHPSYHPPAMYADIALLEFETPVTFGKLIRPACLYQQFDTVPTQAWVSGWGVTSFDGEQSDQLMKALLNVVDNIVCSIRHNKSLAVPYGVSPSMICAGDPHGGWRKDTCQGDSGGPLQTSHPRYSCLTQVIGITSFGEGCALVDSPGVYTRVSHYLTWIEDIVWPEE